MNPRMKIVKLDLVSIKPYITFKNFLILLAMICFYTFSLKNPAIGMTMSSMFSITFSSYPFLIGEKSGIDPLYRLMGIKEREVVQGRYISALLLTILLNLLGMGISWLFAIAFKIPDFFEGMIPFAIGSLAISLFYILLQYPLFFKFGYTKAKSLVGFGLMGIGLLIFLILQFTQDLKSMFTTLHQSPRLFLTGLGGFLFILFIGSMILSARFYQQKELN